MREVVNWRIEIGGFICEEEEKVCGIDLEVREERVGMFDGEVVGV